MPHTRDPTADTLQAEAVELAFRVLAYCKDGVIPPSAQADDLHCRASALVSRAVGSVIGFALNREGQE